MNFEKVLYEKKGSVGWITINDSENRNPITGVTADEMNQCLMQCGADDEVRAVVICGVGKAFSAGGNVKEMKEWLDQGKSEICTALYKVQQMFHLIRTMEKPVIAAIQGSAAGAGMGLALCCDFRMVEMGSKFNMAFVNLGFIPDMGCVSTLVRALGVPRTTELCMLGQTFDAEEAYDWGLITEIVSKGELHAATLALAERLAAGPTFAHSKLKAMINQVAYGDIYATFTSEISYQGLCAKTSDHQEGVNAFMEKRKPIFTGK
jgi:Enoyl-CoA hydratase/carnithine racemase